ncbi:MAG: uracil-DNA glycosylase family protein [Muribaculaceae bacterium]|nr:uracil-DNA glycosylase family protein [Muribaculaceae bacterium]
MEKKVEKHPFTPFLPKGCKVVLCGTFPPKREKWAMDFFYPNFYNDMWRVFGLIFYGDKDRFFDRKNKTVDKTGIQSMLTENKIGIGETATEVVRTKDNASDKFLEIIKPVDLSGMLARIPDCKVVATTGEKAASVIAELSDTAIPKMGERVECQVRMPDGSVREFLHWRLPSTSRAYPMKTEKKAEYYREMFSFLGIV